MKKTNSISQMTIHYPGGARQVIRPNSSFAGDWAKLAEAIAGPYTPHGQTVKFELS